jgi:hypothetical protein
MIRFLANKAGAVTQRMIATGITTKQDLKYIQRRFVTTMPVIPAEFPMPRLGRGTHEWMKILSRPPLAKGGWGDLKGIF